MKLGTIFDAPGIRLLNDPVRGILLRVFLPLLERTLRQKFSFGPDFHLLSRHSVNRPGDYNIFFSDLDMSVVLPKAKLDRAGEVTAFVLRLRKFLPFLGEVEIYSPDEMAAIESSLRGIEDFYQFFRDIRKITWVENDQARFRTPYHRIKSVRGICKILRQNGVIHNVLLKNNVGLCADSVSKHIEMVCRAQIQTPLEFSVFSPYLNFFVTQGGVVLNPMSSGLIMTHPHGVRLLALVPFEADAGELRSALNDVRKIDSIRKIWISLTRAESKIMSGVYRARPDLFPWIPAWVATLESWIPKED